MYPAYDKSVKAYCAKVKSPAVSVADIMRYSPAKGGSFATAEEYGFLNKLSALQSEALVYYDEMFSGTATAGGIDDDSDESMPQAEVVDTTTPVANPPGEFERFARQRRGRDNDEDFTPPRPQSSNAPRNAPGSAASAAPPSSRNETNQSEEFFQRYFSVNNQRLRQQRRYRSIENEEFDNYSHRHVERDQQAQEERAAENRRNYRDVRQNYTGLLTQDLIGGPEPIREFRDTSASRRNDSRRADEMADRDFGPRELP